MIWLRLIPALFLSSFVLVASFSGMAQPAPAESAAPEPAAVATPEHARLLAEILQDEQARRALIDQLLRIAEGGAGAAAPDGAPPEAEVSVAGGLAAYTRDFAEAVTETMYELQAWMLSLWASLMTGGNADLESLGEGALALGGIIVATLIIYYGLGLVAQWVFRWLAGRARRSLPQAGLPPDRVRADRRPGHPDRLGRWLRPRPERGGRQPDGRLSGALSECLPPGRDEQGRPAPVPRPALP